MADDYTFVDAHGNEMGGKMKVKAAWEAYLKFSPDYRIEVSDMLSSGEIIVVIGSAGGTFKEKKTDNNKSYWRLPAACKALSITGKFDLGGCTPTRKSRLTS